MTQILKTSPETSTNSPELTQQLVVPDSGSDPDLVFTTAAFGTDFETDTALLSGLGFDYERRGAEQYLTVPTAEGLTSTARKLGKTDRTFVAVPDVVPLDGFLEMIEVGDIPVAEDPFFKVHDTTGHAVGYELMPKRAFSLLREDAGQAIKEGSEKEKILAAGRIDIWSVAFRTPKEMSPRRLTEFYGQYMNKFTAAILARADYREYVKTVKALQQGGIGSQEQTKLTIPEPDEDLPIK